MNLRARIGLLVQAQGARRAAQEVDGVAKSTKRLGTESEITGRRLKQADRRAFYFRRSLIGLGTAVGVGAVGLAGLGAVLHGAVDEYREAWKVGRATNQVITTTGGVANVTADHAGNLANQLSLAAGMDDELIQKGENLLLTFRNVRNEMGAGNDIFDQTTRLAVDMAAAFTAAGKSMDVSSAAMMLGKALNDPVKGLARLTRAGVSFDAQQIKQIKTLQKHGDMLGAQRIILDEVASEFGGQAKALADPVDQLNTSWKNLEETLGTALAPTLRVVATDLGKFITELQNGTGTGGQVRDVLEDVWGVTKTLWGAVKELAPEIVVLTAGFVAYKAALKTVAAWQAIVWFAMTANPVMLLVSAIAALVAAFTLAYHHVKWFHDAVDATWSWIKGHWQLLASIILAPFVGPLKFAILLFNQVKDAAVWAFDKVKDAIGWVIDKVKDAIGWLVDMKKAIQDLPDIATDFTKGGVPIKDAFAIGLKSVPGMADGGSVTNGGIGLVGEQGPELLDLPTGARVTPLQAHAPVSLSVGGGDRQLQQTIILKVGERELARAVRHGSLQELLNRSPA